jgi:CubicO group peptidase (beta-lactamase class C family)
MPTVPPPTLRHAAPALSLVVADPTAMPHMHPSSHRAARLSRRRLLVLSAGAATAAGIAHLAHSPAVAAAQSAAPMAAAPSAPLVPMVLDADASPRFKAIADLVAQTMHTVGVPGAALGILADGREEHAVFGVANVEANRPVTPDTLFQIGSVTKTYTGTAIMRLVDQGKLELDAPVRTYLPSLRVQDPAVSERVTVRQLLDHSAGFYGVDDFVDTGSGDDACARFVAEVMPGLPQLFPAGAFFSYNNAAFVLLGVLVEGVCGMPYRAAIQELVLDPLQLGASTFDPATVLGQPHADGHWADASGLHLQAPLFTPRDVDPAGGIWSTTRDQLRYAAFHLGDGRHDGQRLLQPTTLEAMQTAQLPVPGLDLAIGLDWFVQELGGLHVFSHGGDTYGQHALLLGVPERQFALVLLTSAQPTGAALELAIVPQMLSRYLGLGEAASHVGVVGAAVAGPDTTSMPLPPDALAAYAGRYQDPGSIWEVRQQDNQLAVSKTVIPAPPDAVVQQLDAPPPRDIPLAFARPDLGLLGGQAYMPFVRGPDGRLGWLLIGMRLSPRQDGPSLSAAPAQLP